MGFFDSFFATPNPQAAAQAQTQGYQNAYNALVPQVQQGNQALQQNYAAGLQPAQQNYGQQSAGQTMLGNALGLNGAQGTQAAQSAFTNSPGFTNAVDLATQNVMRNAASTGQLGSGATDIALGQVPANLEYQQWNNYLSNLQPFMQNATNTANQIGGLYSGLGQGLNQNYNTLGSAAYGTQAGIGNAQAAALNTTGPGWGLLGGALNSFASALGKKAGS